MTKSLMASTFGVVFASVFISVVLVLFAVILFFVWWVDKKKRTIKDFFKSIGHVIYKIFDQINELASGDGVKTVYSDKSMNYSGTEFLPIPQKAPTDKYTYQFLGWDKNGVDDSGNVVVKAIYLQKVQKCFVSVYNEDRQTLLGRYEVEFGAGLNLEDLKPTKAETKEFTYEFAGWDKDITAFYKNDNVYAVYRAIPKKFNYTFFDSDKTTVISQGTAIYGTPILPPPPPHKEPEGGRVFKFVGFSNYSEGMILTKDCSFVAVYESLPESTVFAKSVIDSNGTQTKLNEFAPSSEENSPFVKKQDEIDTENVSKAPDGAEFEKTNFDSDVVVSNEVKVEEDVVDASGEIVSSSTHGYVSPRTEPQENSALLSDKNESDNTAQEEPEQEESEQEEPEQEESEQEEPEQEDIVVQETPVPEVADPVQEEHVEEEVIEPKVAPPKKLKQSSSEKEQKVKEANIGFSSLLFNKRKIIKKDDK